LHEKIYQGDLMARYLARACRRCNGYVGIVIREPGREVPLQAEWSLQSMFQSHGVDRNQKKSRIERQVLRASPA
jgi:hypothetical protein